MLLDRVLGGFLERTLTDTAYYERVCRPLLYRLAAGSPERAHKLAVWALNRAQETVAAAGERLDAPELRVRLFGKEVVPLGTAAGFDKDAEALWPFGELFGFQVIGTVPEQRRRGNREPRVYMDAQARTGYNAQGFPSKGRRHAVRQVSEYREAGGNAVLVASICGLPEGPGELAAARKELAGIATAFAPYVDAFEWNPASPNTEALAKLRTPEEFRIAAGIIAEHAPGKPQLVKVGPYQRPLEGWWLGLIDAYLRGGGGGAVAVNTQAVPRSRIPADSWGYKPGGGQSGRPLYEPAKVAVA
ncbi:MAG TPA: hypothetical protein VJB16_03100, partial [archaeon]|nr:hypothetical protein [archaeon]